MALAETLTPHTSSAFISALLRYEDGQLASTKYVFKTLDLSVQMLGRLGRRMYNWLT